jgi:hypothetical protein
MPQPAPVDSLAALIFAGIPFVQVVAPSTAVSVSPPTQATLPTYAIARKPSGSSATISGAGAITPDVVGWYQLTVSAVAGSFTCHVICLPAGAIALKGQSGAPVNWTDYFRSTFPQWAVAAQWTATVENAAPISFGVTPALWGGGTNTSTIPLNQF